MTGTGRSAARQTSPKCSSRRFFNIDSTPPSFLSLWFSSLGIISSTMQLQRSRPCTTTRRGLLVAGGECKRLRTRCFPIVCICLVPVGNNPLSSPSKSASRMGGDLKGSGQILVNKRRLNNTASPRVVIGEGVWVGKGEG